MSWELFRPQTRARTLALVLFTAAVLAEAARLQGAPTLLFPGNIPAPELITALAFGVLTLLAAAGRLPWFLTGTFLLWVLHQISSVPPLSLMALNSNSFGTLQFALNQLAVLAPLYVMYRLVSPEQEARSAPTLVNATVEAWLVEGGLLLRLALAAVRTVHIYYPQFNPMGGFYHLLRPLSTLIITAGLVLLSERQLADTGKSPNLGRPVRILAYLYAFLAALLFLGRLIPQLGTVLSLSFIFQLVHYTVLLGWYAVAYAATSPLLYEP